MKIIGVSGSGGVTALPQMLADIEKRAETDKILSIDCSEMKEYDKWPFYDHFRPFFGNYMTIFHKTEVQTVNMRSLTVLNFD